MIHFVRIVKPCSYPLVPTEFKQHVMGFDIVGGKKWEALHSSEHQVSYFIELPLQREQKVSEPGHCCSDSGCAVGVALRCDHTNSVFTFLIALC